MANSNTITQGVRVTVTPQYLAAQSDPEARRFVFSYQVTIVNEGDQAVRLRSRHWIIVDSHGNRRDVRGDGVVGDTPLLKPGERYEYSSHCPLETEWGTMEGSYLMEPEDGEPFDANIGRFFLVSQPKPKAQARARAK